MLRTTIRILYLLSIVVIALRLIFKANNLIANFKSIYLSEKYLKRI